MVEEEDDIIMDIIGGNEGKEKKGEDEPDVRGLEGLQKIVNFINDLAEEDKQVDKKDLEEYF